MKKIGFIDLSLDEWHANNYPKWFGSAPLASEFSIAGAWERQPGARALEQWCREMRIAPFASQEELIEHCDAFCVLAPSNPEVHEELAHAALASGKPVFIDKPFAADGAMAQRLFARADQFHTPLFSSSALRFGEELNDAQGRFPVEYMETQGGGSSFWEYAIHQLEMIVSTMGTGIESLMHENGGSAHHVVFRFGDGRRAAMTYHPRLAFAATLLGGNDAVKVEKCTGMFPRLIDAVMRFFKEGRAPVPRDQTIHIARVLHAAIGALQTESRWIPVG